jgi:hypothetical protein
LTWDPEYAFQNVTLKVAGPEGFYYEKTFSAEAPIYFDVSEHLLDGVYTYELVLTPVLTQEIREQLSQTRESIQSESLLKGLREEGELPPEAQSGYFTILDGAILDPEVPEHQHMAGNYNFSRMSPGIPGLNPSFQTFYEDLIVVGSTCVGDDCVTGEVFGSDTLRLKQNNLRIKFQDTSVTAGFPTNDWQITANSSSSGGAEKFSIDDIDGGTTPFTIEAGAPSNSLYVDDGGRLGLGTSAPVVDIQAVSGNTPTLRLEQNGSSGFTPQTWDVAGNEANFFVRDVTSGSTLPFRIYPGADSNSITIAADNDVGMGLSTPSAALHLKRTDGTAQILVEDTGGSDVTTLHMKNNGRVQAVYENTDSGISWQLSQHLTGFIISLVGTGGAEFRVLNDGSVEIGPGPATTFNLDASGDLTIGGNLTELSDRNEKENIVPVDSQQLLEKVASLPISEWSRKGKNGATRHVGPMAQDFYESFGLGPDERHLATVDTSGIALAAIQGLHQQVKERDARIERLEAELAEIKEMLGER